MSLRVRPRNPASAHDRQGRAGNPIGTPISLPSAVQSPSETSFSIVSTQTTAKDKDKDKEMSQAESTQIQEQATQEDDFGSAHAERPSPATRHPISTTHTPRIVEPRPLARRATPGGSSVPASSPTPSNTSASAVRTTRSYAITTSRSRPAGRPIMVTPSGTSRQSSMEPLRDTTPPPSSLTMPPPASGRIQRHATPSQPSTSRKAQAEQSTRAFGLSAASLNTAKRMKAPRGSKPGAPLSAFRLFSTRRRPLVEKQAASVSGPQFNINQAIRQEWNALNASQRKPYEDEAAQRLQQYEDSMEAWREIYGNEQESDAEEEDNDRVNSANVKKSKKRANDAGTAESHRPPAPMNAYLIFRRDFQQHTVQPQQKQGESASASAGRISTAWHTLPEHERKIYRERADDARRAYEEQIAQWKQEYPEEAAAYAEKAGKAIKRPKRRTVSDDEEEYNAMIIKYGKTLSSHRLDDHSTSMTDVSAKSFNRGRASEKTFDLERKLRQGKRERARIRKRLRETGVRTEEELFALEGHPVEEQGSFRSMVKRSASTVPKRADDGAYEEGEEEVITDGNEAIVTEGEEEGISDAESLGGTSTTSSVHPTLREKKFSVQTRIVDGKIVLDESSLQQSQNDDAGVYDATREVEEIDESIRFVNSATHAKRRGRNDRWQAEETQMFLRAVSMWGSDFEMIARMFPTRDRAQIRAKWRNMERTDSTSLDLAFKTRLPVDLSAYSEITGVDLSGDAPQIEIRQPVVKKAEEADGVEREGYGDDDRRDNHAAESEMNIDKKEVEYDENGLEIVEEGEEDDLTDAAAPRKSVNPTATANVSTMAPPSATPMRTEAANAREVAASRRPSRTGRSASAATDEPARARRARSNSTTSHAGTAVSSTTAGGLSASVHGASSIAASDRERRQKRLRDEQRRERERSRRRPVPSGEEEIVEEE